MTSFTYEFERVKINCIILMNINFNALYLTF